MGTGTTQFRTIEAVVSGHPLGNRTIRISIEPLGQPDCTLDIMLCSAAHKLSGGRYLIEHFRIYDEPELMDEAPASKDRGGGCA